MNGTMLCKEQGRCENCHYCPNNDLYADNSAVRISLFGSLGQEGKDSYSGCIQTKPARVWGLILLTPCKPYSPPDETKPRQKRGSATATITRPDDDLERGPMWSGNWSEGNQAWKTH